MQRKMVHQLKNLISEYILQFFDLRKFLGIAKIFLSRKSSLNQTSFSLLFHFGKSEIFLKLKNFLKLNVLKWKNYCIISSILYWENGCFEGHRNTFLKTNISRIILLTQSSLSRRLNHELNSSIKNLPLQN